MKRDDLGNRMKIFYEQIPKIKLIRRCPVIIRIDGKAFHTFTRGFKKPFDDLLIRSMQYTALYLCGNVQNCVLAYTQSDEISLLLIDYQRRETSAWFDYEVQKMCSVAASIATMQFNKCFQLEVRGINDLYYGLPLTGDDVQLIRNYEKSADNGAMFDARVFNIPREEVTNYFYWRQLDASRNSIQMVGQANFGHKELQNKSCNDIQDMLMTQKGINWNDFPAYQKRGSCVIKSEDGWIVDKDIPIFKAEGRQYIESLINVGE